MLDPMLHIFVASPNSPGKATNREFATLFNSLKTRLMLVSVGCQKLNWEMMRGGVH